MTDHRDIEIVDLQEQVAVLRRTAGRLAQENGRLVFAMDEATKTLRDARYLVIRPMPDPLRPMPDTPETPT